jgi:hypothetical protein
VRVIKGRPGWASAVSPVNQHGRVPLVSVKWVDFLSARVGGYRYDQAFTGPLLDQMFVRH